jgi:hypothetical protein
MGMENSIIQIKCTKDNQIKYMKDNLKLTNFVVQTNIDFLLNDYSHGKRNYIVFPFFFG